MTVIAKECAIPLRVDSIPAREAFDPRRGGATPLDHDLPARFVRERLNALQVPFDDIGPHFARHHVNTVYFGHDGHLTPLGHRLVADAVRPVVSGLARAP